MATTQHDLEIEKGASFDFTLRILDALDEPVALSGGSTAFKAHIREDTRKTLAVAFTIAPFPAEAPDGTLRFSLTAAQTLSLNPNKRYLWDFFWTDTAGTRKRVLAGSVVVDPNITHLT